MDRTVKCWNRTCRKRLEPSDSVSRFGVFCSSECESQERIDNEKCRLCGETYSAHDGREQHRFQGA